MKLIRGTVQSVVVCMFSVLTQPWAHSQPEQTDPQQQVVLVELFTSEGCSSCPPADEVLRNINEKQTATGQRIVGISEHVTYWNQLGWKDPFSSAIYTDRQEQYASRFGLDSSYTPQMVVNGEQQLVGSDETSLRSALADQAKRKKIDLRIVSTKVHNGTIAIHFTAAQLLSHHALNIVAVLTEDLASSKVLRGENRGRSLQHVAVAHSLTTVATIHQNTDTVVLFALGEEEQRNKNAACHLILFAQETGQGAIVGTASKPVSLVADL